MTVEELVEQYRQHMKTIELERQAMEDSTDVKMARIVVMELSPKFEEAKQAVEKAEEFFRENIGKSELKAQAILEELSKAYDGEKTVNTPAGTVKYRTNTSVNVVDPQKLIDFLVVNKKTDAIKTFDKKALRALVAAGLDVGAELTEKTTAKVVLD